jgi:hypothetical protein
MDDATTMRMMAVDVDQSPSFDRRGISTSRNIKRLEFAATIAPLLRFGENQAFVELR